MNTEQNICERLSACLLIYDIPDDANFPNPSGRLRPIAIRIQFSGWVIPERDIPYGLITEMRSAGCTVDIVKFDASQGANLINLAIRSIRMEITKAFANARKTRDRAENRLTGDENPAEAVRRYRQFRREQSGITRRLRALLEQFRRATERFGIDPASVDLMGSMAAVRSIRTGMEVRVQAYRKMMEDLDVRFGRDNGITAAMRRDMIPAGIVADYAQDRAETNEQTEDAEFFRNLFSED
jgi:hypothetical protein